MASTGDTWRLGRRPALDGLRGVAVLLVVLHHARVPLTSAAGVVGVTMFFVLSGFLITALLLEEYDGHGRIRFGRFYRRRFLRLAPALVACVAAVFLVAALWGNPWFCNPGWALATLLYVSNWLHASIGPQGALHHTWSLAVEEQFYLTWPLVLAALLRWRRLGWLVGVAIAGIGGAWLARFTLWHDGAGLFRVQFGADTHADGLLLGCVLAIALHGRPVPRLPRYLGVAGLSGCVVLSAAPVGYATHVLVPGLAAGLAVLVVLELAVGGQLLTAGWLRWTGRRSYGLYLWHMPVSWGLHMVYGFGQPWAIHLVILVPASLALTVLSWRYVESPFLRLKHRSDGDRVEAGGRLPRSVLGGQPVR